MPFRHSQRQVWGDGGHGYMGCGTCQLERAILGMRQGGFSISEHKKDHDSPPPTEEKLWPGEIVVFGCGALML